MSPLLLIAAAHAAEVGGYFRVMARPDLLGGDGRLGASQLSGRLLNDGPWGLLDVRQALLAPEGDSPWGDLHFRVEGGAAAGADATNGSLLAFRLSQLYFQAGNVGVRNVTFRMGTLETTFGDLWLYDARPTQMLLDVLGLGATWSHAGTEVMIGAGDAGWSTHGPRYHPVPSAGGSVRHHFGDHVVLGVGGQLWREAATPGDPDAPQDTPGLTLDDWSGGAPAEAWLGEHPGAQLPASRPTDAGAWKVAAFAGLEKLGPVTADRLQLVVQRRLPDGPVTETIDGASVVTGATHLTDARDEIIVGNEMELSLVPHHLEAAWGALADIHHDPDDPRPASPDNRTALSTVLRTQLAVTHTLALLGEASVVHERSHQGAAFASRPGVIDARLRDTEQLKGGLVISPAGPGLGDRPALRLLYGAQHCSEPNAWPGASATADKHWHSLVSLEGEAWF